MATLIHQFLYPIIYFGNIIIFLACCAGIIYTSIKGAYYRTSIYVAFTIGFGIVLWAFLSLYLGWTQH